MGATVFPRPLEKQVTADGNNIGTLSSLTTTVKTDLVSAVNEVKSATTTNSQAIATINNNITPSSISTGITNVYATKMGKMVICWFIDKNLPTISSNGWQTLFTLPNGLKPHDNVEFVAVISANSAEALEARIKTDGTVNAYGFTSVSGKPCCGQVVYFVD